MIDSNALNRALDPLLPMLISPILHNHLDFERDWKAVMEIFKAFEQGNFFRQFEVYNDFDEIVIDLLRDLYQFDDCVDGIEMIQDKKELEVSRHEKIYKECYQLFLSFISDLNVCLKQFFDFPFHKMMDESLSDLSYRFSKEKLPQLVEKMKQIQSIDQIKNIQSAVRQYQIFMPELGVLRQFIYSFRKRLENLYFINTDMHLHFLLKPLHKRHLVLDLFSNDEN